MLVYSYYAYALTDPTEAGFPKNLQFVLQKVAADLPLSKIQRDTLIDSC